MSSILVSAKHHMIPYGPKGKVVRQAKRKAVVISNSQLTVIKLSALSLKLRCAVLHLRDHR